LTVIFSSAALLKHNLGVCQGAAPLDFHSGFGDSFAETDESRRLSHFSRFAARLRSNRQSVQPQKSGKATFLTALR
jgi:hypothetical protein